MKSSWCLLSHPAELPTSKQAPPMVMVVVLLCCDVLGCIESGVVS